MKKELTYSIKELDNGRFIIEFGASDIMAIKRHLGKILTKSIVDDAKRQLEERGYTNFSSISRRFNTSYQNVSHILHNNGFSCERSVIYQPKAEDF